MNSSYVFVFDKFDGSNKFAVVQFVLDQPSIIYENGEIWRDALDILIDSNMFWKSFKDFNMIETPVDVAFVSVSDEQILDSLDLAGLTCSVNEESVCKALAKLNLDCSKYRVLRPSGITRDVCALGSQDEGIIAESVLKDNATTIVQENETSAEKKERTGLTHDFFVEKHKIHEDNRIFKKPK